MVRNHPSPSNKPFLSILSLYLSRSIAEYKVPEQITARAASPGSCSRIIMWSQLDPNGGDECSSFPLLIARQSQQLSGEGYCINAVCNSLLMQLPHVCLQTDKKVWNEMSKLHLGSFHHSTSSPRLLFWGKWLASSLFSDYASSFLQNTLLPFLKSSWLPEERHCSVRGITDLQPALELNQPPTEAAGST